VSFDITLEGICIISALRISTVLTEAGFSQWCPVTGSKAMGTNWNMGGIVWTWGNTFLLWGWLSTGTGCSGEWWSLPPWTQSKSDWTWFWATA